MITPSSVQRIIDAVRIEEVVGEFVNLKRSGSGYKGLCPFHSEKSGSFMVAPAKNIFKCFGCGLSGHSELGFACQRSDSKGCAELDDVCCRVCWQCG